MSKTVVPVALHNNFKTHEQSHPKSKRGTNKMTLNPQGKVQHRFTSGPTKWL